MKSKFIISTFLVVLVIGFMQCKKDESYTALPGQIFAGDTIITVPVDTFLTLNALPVPDGLKGKWTVVSPNNNTGFFSNSTSATSKFGGKYRTDYRLCWKVTNGKDTSRVFIHVTFPGVYIDPRDNQQYTLVKINNQIWMAQNFRYRTDSTLFYNNDSVSNFATNGRLYTLEDAATSTPAGWRLPTREDLNMLITYVKNTAQGKSNNEAKALKAKSGWTPTTANGTDDFGFAVLPSGFASKVGTAATIFTGSAASFWTSSLGGNNTDGYIWPVYVLFGTTNNIVSGSGFTYTKPASPTVFWRSVRYVKYE
jgi:Fibrobacter succinogenes major domain (Fib_succ_major).